MKKPYLTNRVLEDIVGDLTTEQLTSQNTQMQQDALRMYNSLKGQYKDDKLISIINKRFQEYNPDFTFQSPSQLRQELHGLGVEV